MKTQLSSKTQNVPRLHSRNESMNQEQGNLLQKLETLGTRNSSHYNKYFSELTSPNSRKEIFSKKISLMSNFLQVFPDLGKNSTILLNICEKKFDQGLRECIEVSHVPKFLELQQERVENLLKLNDEFLQETLEKTLGEKNSNLLDIMKLLLAEYNNIFFFFEEMLKKQWKNALLEEDNKKKPITTGHQNFIIGLDNLIKMKNPFLPVEKRFQYNEELATPLRESKIRLKLEENPECRKYIAFLDEIELNFNTIYEKLTNVQAEYECLKSDHERLSSYLNTALVLSKSETQEILNQKTNGEKLTTQIHRFSAIDEMKADFKRQIQDMNLQIEKLQREISLRKQREFQGGNIDPEKFHTVNGKRIRYKDQAENVTEKEIQVNLFPLGSKNTISIGIIAELEPFLPPDLPLGDNCFGKECTLSFISLILTDKLITDFNDFVEKKCRKSMHAYLFEWFLIKFGNQGVAASFLKDFINSVEKLSTKHERCEIFSKMCGITSNGPQANQERLDFRRRFYGSAEATKLYAKLAFMARFGVKDPSVNAPLFPNIFYEENELVNNELALNSIRDILREEGETDEQVKIVSDGFDNLIVSDIYVRQDMALKRGGKKGVDKSVIRFDYLAKYLLDYYADKNNKRLEHVSTGLKLSQTSRIKNDYFYDEFCNIAGSVYKEKSRRWFETGFFEFVVKNKEKSLQNVNSYLISIYDYLVEPEMREDFYLDAFSSNSKDDARKRKKTVFMSKNNSIKKSSTAISVKNEDDKELYRKVFDVINSLVVLEECYESIKDLLRKEENGNDNLFLINQNFKKELQKLPKNMKTTRKNFDAVLTTYDRNDLIERIEAAWKMFRTMCDIAISKKK